MDLRFTLLAKRAAQSGYGIKTLPEHAAGYWLYPLDKQSQGQCARDMDELVCELEQIEQRLGMAHPVQDLEDDIPL
ncbi:hypothetical protein [Ferrimonas gelatinilytica]|uniref:Uncharacterized protein n=1 Tax=Ferrimonas gelatinilytica TaxID=1255257 RepID=A0ABP9RVD1_9GAMM